MGWKRRLAIISVYLVIGLELYGTPLLPLLSALNALFYCSIGYSKLARHASLLVLNDEAGKE